MKTILGSAFFFAFLSLLFVCSSLAGNRDRIVDDTPISIPRNEPVFLQYEAKEPGLYSFHLNTPGSIQIFLKEDVDKQKKRKVTPLESSSNPLENISLEHLLLIPGTQYILALAANSDAELRVEKTQNAAVSETRTIPLDSWLLVSANEKKTISTQVPAKQPVKIVVFQEPGQNIDVEVKDRQIPPSGLYPHIFGLHESVFGNDANLYINPKEKQKNRHVLIHLTASNEDEAPEPDTNRTNGLPTKVSSLNGLKGTLLSSDTDAFLWQVEDKGKPINLKIESDTFSSNFEFILNMDKPVRKRLLDRKSNGHGIIEINKLKLEPGTYSIRLARLDRRIDPVKYRFSVLPFENSAKRSDQEPNDLIANQTFDHDFTITGDLAESDTDLYTHLISEGGQLWRYVLFGKISSITVRDKSGKLLYKAEPHEDNYSTEFLTLSKGEKTIRLSGRGKYSLRAISLGSPTPGFEKEPNNDPENTGELKLGEVKKGIIRKKSDRDLYYITLSSRQPVNLTITPPDDGHLEASLNYSTVSSVYGKPVGKSVSLAPGADAFSFSSELPAGDYTLAVNSPDDQSLDSYAIATSLEYENSIQEPDNQKGKWRFFDPKHFVHGQLGGFNNSDHYIIPTIPDITTLVVCRSEEPVKWLLGPYGDEEKKHQQNDSGLFSLNPPDNTTEKENYLLLSGYSSKRNSYTCNARLFNGIDFSSITKVKEPDKHLVKNGEYLYLTKKGQTTLELDFPKGKTAVFQCKSELGEKPEIIVTSSQHSTVSPESNVILLNNDNGSSQAVHVRLKKESSALCGLAEFDSLPTISSRLDGELVNTIERDSGYFADNNSSRRLFRPLSTKLPLAVDVGFSNIQVRAYAKAGQRLSGIFTITNTGKSKSRTQIRSRLFAGGWEALDMPENVTLEAGEKQVFPFEIIVPPMVAENSYPAFEVSLQQGWRLMKKILEFEVSQDVNDVEFINYWSIPEELRGSINVLWDSFGARLIEVDDKEVTEKDAARYSFLHDGIALHYFNQSAAPGRTMSFKTGLKAPVTGAMFTLLSSRTRATWPNSYTIDIKDLSGQWHRAATGNLEAASRPQYIKFDKSIIADEVKLVINDCQLNEQCTGGPSIEEFQLLADPNWKPEIEFNLADAKFGGQVLYAEPCYDQGWNSSFLRCKEDRRACGGSKLNEGQEAETVIGFHRGRTAYIEELRWENNPKEKRKFDVAVYAALDNPFGPWQKIGMLGDSDTGKRILTLKKPVWAKYIKLSSPVEKLPQLFFPPTHLEIIEAKDFQSILGTWEENSNRAVYEDVSDISTMEVLNTAGGKTRAQAVALTLDETIESSVKLERNEDWFSFTIPGKTEMEVTLSFHNTSRPEQSLYLEDSRGREIELQEKENRQNQTDYRVIVAPGEYYLKCSSSDPI